MEELTVAIASEVIGATLFAWVIGNIVNLVLNLDPAERNRKSMMNYLTEYLRVVPLSSKAKQTIARNYAFHLEVSSCDTFARLPLNTYFCPFQLIASYPCSIIMYLLSFAFTEIIL